MPRTIVTRRDPLSEWNPFGRVLGSIFDDAALQSMLGATEEGTLAVDVAENDAEVIVRASVPGFEKKDIDIEVHEGVLSINATHAEESEETGERFYRRERRIGSLSRRIALPSQVVEDQARAELLNGVLTLRLPKTTKPSARKVQID